MIACVYKDQVDHTGSYYYVYIDTLNEGNNEISCLCKAGAHHLK